MNPKKRIEILTKLSARNSHNKALVKTIKKEIQIQIKLSK